MNTNLTFAQGLGSATFSISVAVMHFLEMVGPLFGMAAVIIGIITGIRTFQVKSIEREIKQIELQNLKDEQTSDQH